MYGQSPASSLRLDPHDSPEVESSQTGNKPFNGDWYSFTRPDPEDQASFQVSMGSEQVLSTYKNLSHAVWVHPPHSEALSGFEDLATDAQSQLVIPPVRTSVVIINSGSEPVRETNWI
jgi:hypothetical protein